MRQPFEASSDDTGLSGGLLNVNYRISSRYDGMTYDQIVYPGPAYDDEDNGNQSSSPSHSSSHWNIDIHEPPRISTPRSVLHCYFKSRLN